MMDGRFHTTRWSVVLRSRGTTPESGESLARLCETYWQPVYEYIRSRGESSEDARDMTQDFFTRFLEKQYVAAADPARGRFRSFLLASVQHFLCNEWDRRQARKRGGDARHVSLEETGPDGQLRVEPAAPFTPETLFEQRWAATLLQRVLDRLRDEHERCGKRELIDVLLPLLCESDHISYAAAGERLNTTAGALRVAVHRLRRRYRTLLLEEIAATVDNPDDLASEVQHLLRAVQQPPGALERNVV